jgi:DNA-binding MarR family transcriptional regulator
MSESLARVTALTAPASVSEMTHLVMAFSELRKQNARAIGAVSAGYGISPTDLRALSFVSLSDGATPKSVAGHLGMTTGSLTTLADRLESVGFLERTANPRDRRSVLLRLTPRGGEVMVEVNVLYVRAFSNAFDEDDIPRLKEAFLGLANELGRLVD